MLGVHVYVHSFTSCESTMGKLCKKDKLFPRYLKFACEHQEFKAYKALHEFRVFGSLRAVIVKSALRTLGENVCSDAENVLQTWIISKCPEDKT